jgi:hypothetical protein
MVSTINVFLTVKSMAHIESQSPARLAGDFSFSGKQGTLGYYVGVKAEKLQRGERSFG